MFCNKEYGLNRGLLKKAIRSSFLKLKPKGKFNNLTMFALYIGAIIVTLFYLASFWKIKDTSQNFMFYIMIAVWLTVLAQNFAEAVAEEKLREKVFKTKFEGIPAYKISSVKNKENPIKISSNELKKGDLILIKEGEKIPADGEIIEKEVTIGKNSITEGQDISEPKIKKKLQEDSKTQKEIVKMGEILKYEWSIIKVLSETAVNIQQGRKILSKNINKNINKNILELFFAFIMSIFIVVSISLYFYIKFSYAQSGSEESIPITYLIAFLACLTPTAGTQLFNLTELNESIKFGVKNGLQQNIKETDLYSKNYYSHSKEQKPTCITWAESLMFYISNDIAKYFCIIPYLFINLYPSFEVFNIMKFSSIESVLLSCIIYNILSIIIFPLIALKKFKYKECSPNKLILKNLIIYGVGGFLISLMGIKFIDIIVSSIRIF